MKVGLLSLDSKNKNFALEKVRKYYKNKKIKVEDFEPLTSYKEVWISKIFTETKDYDGFLFADKVFRGGTGYDIKSNLPKEIEIIKPKLNFGFLTRGCIRNCSFCVVPSKEGKLYIEAENGLLDLWDGKSKEITVMDNNITGNKKYFLEILKQAQELKLKLDFNQGLDIRLIDDEMCYELKKTKTKDIRFAFDNIKLFPLIKKKMKILHKYKIKGMWYVLSGFDSTIKEDIFRVNYLIANKQRAYLMRHKNCNKSKKHILLASWVNSPLWGKGNIPFEVFLKETEYGKRYQKYFVDSDYK